MPNTDTHTHRECFDHQELNGKTEKPGRPGGFIPSGFYYATNDDDDDDGDGNCAWEFCFCFFFVVDSDSV